jgi:hypothetical protein
MKYYAGIGSRQITPKIQYEMTKLAIELSHMGYTLRSGNATGSDQAFASGATKAQIWLPWRDFEKEFQDEHPDHGYRLVGDECCPGEPDPEAWDSVEKFHPNYKNMVKLKGTAQEQKYYKFMRFMSRNYRQVRGWGEPDSEFVVCWTEDGLDKGGTAQALRIARHFDIPIFNMFNMTSEEILNEISKLKLLY